MAEPNTPIPFTVGDQERLKWIEAKLDALCQSFDPALVERVKSLEGSRKRLYALFSGTFLTGLAIWIRKIINGG